jgi:RNA polymerase sigma factor (sigma-70 family)
VADSYDFQIRSYEYRGNGENRCHEMATIAPDVPVLARDEAFEQLYRRYVKDVYHYALALLRNPADAEDVTQTTFLNAYRAFQRGEEVLKPQNWLIKIAHNVARTRYASSRRRVKEVPLEDHVDQLALPEEEKPNVAGVLRALGRLPFNQRAALVMRELEGRSYAEIADTLGVSVAAVETLIFRARRSLRVRTAALRSILAVPVPSSLTSLVDGGGAAAGGIGAGMLIKAAVALVVGGIATGLGVERSTHAAPAPKPLPTPLVSAPVSASVARHAPSPAKGTAAGRARPSRLHAARRVATGPVPQSTFHQPSAVRPVGAQAASGQSVSSSAPAGTSAPKVVTETATQAVQTVVQTVDQTVASVAAALPVSVPQVPPLPVQPPPLPKLP